MVYQGSPEAICLTRDQQDLQEAVRFCSSRQMPLTFCGSQTSMTGSSAADTGVILPLYQQNKILEIGFNKNTQTPFVVTEPGVILADLKHAVLQQGFFYPPDPTSFREAQIGATVATNATGEDSFKYGPTRWYVEELDVITPGGELKKLKRQKPVVKNLIKNTAGYFLDGEEIDEIIGSEGTLAVIQKIKLQLLPNQQRQVCLFLLPFSSFAQAIKAVVFLTQQSLKPRALELIGPGASDYFKSCAVCPVELQSQNCFLYLKEEYTSEKNFNDLVDQWHHIFSDLYAAIQDKPNLEKIFIAKSDSELEAIRQCRHYIPLKVNEEFFAYKNQGGGKVGTDWWVPLSHLEDMMAWTYEKALQLKIPFLVFAHIGNGHPHWNFLTRHAEEYQRAKEFVLQQCQRAVICGGGVAGEHGIGKIKHDILSLQQSPQNIKRMIALKNKWDPQWIFGRGNILNYLKK